MRNFHTKPPATQNQLIRSQSLLLRFADYVYQHDCINLVHTNWVCPPSSFSKVLFRAVCLRRAVSPNYQHNPPDRDKGDTLAPQQILPYRTSRHRVSTCNRSGVIQLSLRSPFRKYDNSCARTQSQTAHRRLTEIRMSSPQARRAHNQLQTPQCNCRESQRTDYSTSSRTTLVNAPVIVKFRAGIA